MELKSFLDSKTCLSCNGCCHFSSPTSEWRPKAGPQEQDKINQLVLQEKVTVGWEHPYIKTKNCHGLFACQFFDPDTHKCAIYLARPLECRLYPFVPTRIEGKMAFSVHTNCPYLVKMKDTPSYFEYIEHFKEWCQQEEVQKIFFENEVIFSDYIEERDELHFLFFLEELNVNNCPETRNS